MEKIFGDKDRGPWIITFTGKHFHYKSPRVEDIDPMDIAISLSRECRYAGHSISFYSVAQHSVLVSEKMESSFFYSGGPDIYFYPNPSQVAHIPVEEGMVDRTLAAIGMLGLLHDASEAYMRDLPSPLKSLLSEYKAIEAEVSCVIFDKWDLNTLRSRSHVDAMIHKTDKRVFATEVRDLIKHKEVWEEGWEPYTDIKIDPAPPDTACVLFLARFHELLKRIEG